MWSEAMTMYQEIVLKGHVRYERFVDDFLNSHTFHDSADAWSKNQHNLILGRIRHLLRYETVMMHYCTFALSQEHFNECMTKLMLHQELPEQTKFNFQCLFSPPVISLITKTANAIPLFKTEVTDTDMDALFNVCTPVATPLLVATNNQHLAYFLSQMDVYGLISRKYQQVVDRNGLIGSSRGGRALRAHDLARALEEINGSVNPIKGKIEDMVKLIKLEALKSKENALIP